MSARGIELLPDPSVSLPPTPAPNDSREAELRRQLLSRRSGSNILASRISRQDIADGGITADSTAAKTEAWKNDPLRDIVPIGSESGTNGQGRVRVDNDDDDRNALAYSRSPTPPHRQRWAGQDVRDGSRKIDNDRYPSVGRADRTEDSHSEAGPSRHHLPPRPELPQRSYHADRSSRGREESSNGEGHRDGRSPRLDRSPRRPLPREHHDDTRAPSGYDSLRWSRGSRQHHDDNRRNQDNGYGGPLRMLPPQRIGFDEASPRHGNGRSGRVEPSNRSGFFDRRNPPNFEQRRLEREASTISIWPPSPKRAYSDRSDSDGQHRKKFSKRSTKSRQRSKYSSTETDQSSEAEEKHRREQRRSKQKSRRKDQDGRSDDSDGERRRSKKRARRRARDQSGGLTDEEWVEKSGSSRKRDRDNEADRDKEQPLTLEELAAIQRAKAEEDEVVGPVLPSDVSKLKSKTHYKDMSAAEASAMAAYLSSNQRIPRRGEIGYDAEAIKLLEESGYVMSGSRHKKMNAVRLRKENQVISAEEKRAILNLQREEGMRKEGVIISQFKELMDTAIKRGEAKK